MKIELLPQECEGTYKFNGQIVYTRGIENKFGDLVFKLVADTMSLLTPLINENKADYLQVVIAELENGRKIKVWIIDDVSHITFLLPSEY